MTGYVSGDDFYFHLIERSPQSCIVANVMKTKSLNWRRDCLLIKKQKYIRQRTKNAIWVI